jgi:K+-transporting ATPase ATPase A chain
MNWLVAGAVLLTVGAPLALLHRPLGDYMAWVFTSPKHWRLERVSYRLVGVDPDGDQTWQAYLRAILTFSIVAMVGLYGLQRLQNLLPLSEGLPAVRPDLAFNTAASFVGNTNCRRTHPNKRWASWSRWPG